MRSSLRPRNSSTSSFSGSPVPKIDEEIDPIEANFEFSSTNTRSKKTALVGGTKRAEIFFPLIDSLTRNESSFNSSTSSQGSSAVKPGKNSIFDLTTKNKKTSEKLTNEAQLNLSCSMNDQRESRLFSRESQRMVIEIYL